MKTKILSLIFIAFAIFPAINTAFSQPGDKIMHRACFQEVHEYVLTNVFPVMAEKRTAFNENLSASEIQEINELILEFETLKSEFPGDRPLFGKGNQEFKGKGMHHGFEGDSSCSENHAKMKEIMLKAKAIADNHTVEIEAIMTEIEPQKLIWKADIDKIFLEYGIDSTDIECHKAKMKQEFKNEDCDELRPEKINHFERMFLPQVFILMDFTETLAENTSEIEKVKIFPNPATDIFTIDYEISEKTDLTIKIADNWGNIVETFELKDIAEGEYSKEISTIGYIKGLYFIVLESEKGLVTRKVFVEK